MQSSNDISRVVAFLPTGAATVLMSIGAATPLVAGGKAGAWVSAGTTIAFVSVCATAEKAARMKTKITLKLFMVLQFCGFRQNSSNLRRSGATEGNHPVNLHSDRKSTRLNSSHANISYA